MLASYNNLKSLPVFTEDGDYLGKVCNLMIDLDAHIVRQYEVRSGRIRGKTYLIPADSVLEIRKDKIIISDAPVRELAQKEELARLAGKASPALTFKL